MFFVHTTRQACQASMLLGLKRLLVHNLVTGCCAQTPSLPLSCLSLLPPSLDWFSTAQTCTEHQLPLPGPCRQAGTGGACCHVLERGARPAECHLCVPGQGHWISSFLLLAALTRRRAIADGTCPEILLWKHAREGDLCRDNSSALQNCTKAFCLSWLP